MRKSVLVIDDDHDDLILFREALSQINPSHECFTFSNGPDALEHLKQQIIKPHFIFLDLNMPGMRGTECLREIKKTPFLSQIPVIIWSTSTSLRDLEAVYQFGASIYVSKPRKFGDLVKKIKKIIEA